MTTQAQTALAATGADSGVSNDAGNPLDQQLATWKQATIMMVDDEPIIIETLQMFLEDAGYENFVTTTEPRKALNMLVLKKPDVVLLDLMMPEVNGLEILTWMRAEGGLKHIPVIILTSATDSETKLKALELGATDFLGKPVDSSELALRLRNTLAAKSYQDKLLYYDGLTGLPNRRLFLNNLESELKRSKAESKACAVLHIGLDRFRQINDTLGHGLGDAVLKAVAGRLDKCIRESEFITREDLQEEPPIARIGGDEFALLIPDVERLENATLLARKVLASLAKPYRLHAREIFVTASIGISVYPMDADNMDSLLKHADAAVSHAKRRGRNTYQYYSKELNAKSGERLGLENELRKALEKRELFFQFQPKVEIATGRVVGAEALLRWKHPKLGVVPPDKFIPIAEEIGMIEPLGEWALYAACMLNKRWQSQGIRPVRISVNVSGRQFQNAGRLKLSIRNALERSGLEGKYLGIELTEGTIMENPDENTRSLKDIKDMGVMLSIDDFGTGYSSLSYLKKFPLDELKIDRSFLKEVPKSEDDAAIVSALIALAHGLSMSVVAEGVENEDQLAFLRDRGCDEYQGHLFSKPVLAPDFLNQVNETSTAEDDGRER